MLNLLMNQLLEQRCWHAKMGKSVLATMPAGPILFKLLSQGTAFGLGLRAIMLIYALPVDADVEITAVAAGELAEVCAQELDLD